MFTKNKVAIAADHAGYELKSAIVEELRNWGIEVRDLGTHTRESVDYPDFAHRLAESLSADEYGILMCGTGNGVCMSANRHGHIRAGLAWNAEVAGLLRRHNDANVLCLPARFVTETEALAAVEEFLSAEFEGGRHQRRVEKISSFGQ
jgi:ribose 5-phosphate isomerase B